ncbi:conserved hypothetical protein [Vibrio nigripulchritudo SFn27]|uniref:Uncharacterized protein n=1 Tax=Vibrio nigripulchritudo TaxID=28173 RepID=U4K4X5_9VIBR|nr:hypothetical protein [Vibrio nigripulchritudo]CCN34538.1 conserved hypothetical protein [Vibrio nigripulchritudo AM115]CCN42160.1 conserved hypothetical protein [Vibrio nigripulchritudo FTn2]CCN62705.1 conserved hypothetical protein [Vibrio nigripulchritudo POn4]CCN75539.1 conserved hypothetical protein [Vibrio nigripulchritudo SO65]CCN85249.1 conserved hypothetical protein [Vibrio nigripulchritudo BLFn1]
MKRFLVSIASIVVGLITLFTGLFMAVFIGIAALIMGKRIERKMAKEGFTPRRAAVIEGEYDDITSK